MTNSKSEKKAIKIKKVDKSASSLTLPLLPLRDIVNFPEIAIPIDVGRKQSIDALKAAIDDNQKYIILATQKDESVENPKLTDLYSIGTLNQILQLIRLPGNILRVIVKGVSRVKINKLIQTNPYNIVSYEVVDQDNDVSGAEYKALESAVMGVFAIYVKGNNQISSDILKDLEKIDEPELIADTLADKLRIPLKEKQSLLEIVDVKSRFEKLYLLIESEIESLQMESKIRSRVKSQMDKTQREYYLNEKMKAIQRELGDKDDPRDEHAEFKAKIEKSKMPKETLERATSDLKKLRQMPPMSAEATVIRNYLDWLTNIPWSKKSKLNFDLNKALAKLNSRHHGLDKVKQKIIEYLAVQARNHNSKKRLISKGTILCLVGPPGVGKTSLGKSIAEATGRTFVRMSLGGIKDEAEIRGHRRTYIGSMPGKIIQGMRRAKCVNPLFLLDEIDKLGSDWRGDPSSALLEVLDPEQNSTFSDHYLEVDYNLSNVMFLTTANSMNMPLPLLDRMEILELSGYTEDEKIEIAQQHLIPKLSLENGLLDDEWEIKEDGIVGLIRNYTRESGVRNLERELSSLMRKTIKDNMSKKAKQTKTIISNKNLSKGAGVWKYRYGLSEEKSMIGITTGLAWTGQGGELLTIEAVRLPGKGRVSHTGKLGDVMRESIQASENYIKSRAPSLGISPQRFAQTDIHVHVPEGATPKDGPSAGVAMITSIVSALTDIPVRHNVAMTGEITLRGRVLPIGGLKEKLLAAQRGNITTVLIPMENKRHLEEVPTTVKKSLTIIPVDNVNEVLKHALVTPIIPVIWNIKDEALAARLIGGGDMGISSPVAN